MYFDLFTFFHPALPRPTPYFLSPPTLCLSWFCFLHQDQFVLSQIFLVDLSASTLLEETDPSSPGSQELPVAAPLERGWVCLGLAQPWCVLLSWPLSVPGRGSPASSVSISTFRIEFCSSVMVSVCFIVMQQNNIHDFYGSLIYYWD